MVTRRDLIIHLSSSLRTILVLAVIGLLPGFHTQSVLAAGEFSGISSGLPGLQYADAAWGDYDNDGDLDLAISGWISAVDSARIYQNNGGTFTDIGAGLSGISGYVAWGDYDNDGYLDLLITGTCSAVNNRVTRLYHNNAGTSFSEIDPGVVGLDNGSVAWGDYDRDGDLDILIAGNTNGLSNGWVTKIYRNTGGIFSDINAGLPGLNNNAAAWADFDNDGDLDIALTGSPAGKIYRNDSGVFTDMGVTLANVYTGSLDWGDYDNDGDQDLLLTGSLGPMSYLRVSKVYRYDGGSTFTDINAGLYGVSDGGAEWGDYDNDGDLDIALSGFNQSGNVAKIYRNDGGVFVDISAGLTAQTGGSVDWGDFDGDGLLDLLVTGGNLTNLYQNNLTTTNQPAGAPTILSTVPNACGVTLSWAAATDDHTPVNGLNYNLRIGTTPGGSDVLSPAADAASGYHRLPNQGNFQGSMGANLLLTPGKTYYWSVQAIDSAYAGGAFASEKSFSIALPTTVYVDNAYTTSTPGWDCTHFAELQNAIDMVAFGGQVQVMAGSYGSFTLNRAVDVILNGATVISDAINQITGTLTGPAAQMSVTGSYVLSGGELDVSTGSLITNSYFKQTGGKFLGPSSTFRVGSSLELSGGTMDLHASNTTIYGYFLQTSGVFTAPAGTLSVKGDFLHTGGSYDVNNGTLQLNGSASQNLLGNLPFYDLTINNSGTFPVVAYLKTITVTNILYVQDGILSTGGDLKDVAIDTNGSWILAEDATLHGNFLMSGKFMHNSHRLTFAGNAVQNIMATEAMVLWNLTVAPGSTLIDYNTTSMIGIAGSVDNQGQIRTTRTINAAGLYDFGLTGVSVNVTTRGTLSALTVTDYGANHPNATGTPGGNGTSTGRYWDLTPTGGGYTLDLMLPHALGANHGLLKACRYEGAWDCQRTTSDAGMVRLNGLTSLSTWAAGINVSPTYVGLVSFESLPLPGLLTSDHWEYFGLGLFWANLIGLCLWGIRRRRKPDNQA